MRHTFYFFCIFLQASSLPAQNPASDHAWITTNNISVRITPTGIHPNNSGGFLLNQPGAPAQNLLSHLSPWMGGVDPAGNLMVACEMDDSGASDWVSGFKDIPNSGKVWKVTLEQIRAHIADFNDNGVIENPIPEIFSWPGRGNTSSLAYNGFTLPNDWQSIAPGYFDKNENGIYNPESGEYPQLKIRGHSKLLAIDQLVYAAFFNDTTGALTHGWSVHSEFGLQAFTYSCESQPFAENSIFLVYTFKYTGSESIDSTCFGLYSDFDIGDPHDDYLGTWLPNRELIYAYNSDTLYDANLGENPPMIGIRIFRAPLDSNGIEARPFSIMPILSGGQTPACTKPTYPGEFYTYMTGHWKDRTPLTIGGTGYGGINPTKIAYPGYPSDANGWSELLAANPLGDRVAFITHKPTSLLPETVSEFIISLTVSNADGLNEQFKQIRAINDLQDGELYGYHWMIPVLEDLCFPAVDADEPAHSKSLSIYPNPASSHCMIKSNDVGIREVQVFDMFGKIVLKKSKPSLGKDLDLNTASLAPGVYYLYCALENGYNLSKKLVIAR